MAASLQVQRIGRDMAGRYRTPEELVAGLQERGDGARAQLWQLLRAPLERLMGELISQHGLEEDHELLTTHALHSAETALRTRPARAFAGLSWTAFRGALLLQIARMSLQPQGAGAIADRAEPPALPESPGYQSQTFFRPSTRLGNHFFGGDWYAGRCLADGSLWVLLADVTGHGYYAYLLASGLPAVWQLCWNAHQGRSPEPADLLARMHEFFSDCLPEGIFLECTLARLGSDGEITVAPAGGTRLWVRSDGRRPDLVRLRGAWLGLRAPRPEEQHTLSLHQGDELLLATDGLFDQLDEEGAEAVARASPRHGLFEVVRDLLERSLASERQRDDITMVLLRRRGPDGGRPRMLPFPGTPRSNGTGDVPV
jgi:hypothetical protein